MGSSKQIPNDPSTQATSLEGRRYLDVSEKKHICSLLNGQDTNIPTVDDDDLQPGWIEVFVKVIGLNVVIPTPQPR